MLTHRLPRARRLLFHGSYISEMQELSFTCEEKKVSLGMLRIFSQRLRLVKDADSGYTQNDLFRVISEELVCHNARLPPPAEANQE